MTSDEKQERDQEVEKQSKGDFSSLLELRDIYDELHTIMKLFKEQKSTLTSMAKRYGGPTWPIESQGTNIDPRSPGREGIEAQTIVQEGMKHLEEAYRSITAFETNVRDMIENSENAEKAVSGDLMALIVSDDIYSTAVSWISSRSKLMLTNLGWRDLRSTLLLNKADLLWCLQSSPSSSLVSTPILD